MALTPEEVAALMESDEYKAALKLGITEATRGMVPAGQDIAGLVENRDKIMDELKAERKKRRKQSDGDGPSAADLEDVRTELKSAQALAERNQGLSQTRIQELETSLDQSVVGGEIIRASVKHDANEYLELKVRDRVKRVIVDGKPHAVPHENGQPILKEGAKTATEFITVDDWVAGLKKLPEYAPCFNGAGVSGTGGEQNLTPAGSGNDKTVDVDKRTGWQSDTALIEKIASGEVVATMDIKAQ